MLLLSLPASYKYLIWSANSGRSLFDLLHEKKKLKKNQKYLLYEEKQKSEQGLNDIWSTITPDENKKAILSAIQPILVEFKKNINNKIHEFLKVKNELLLEVTMLGNLIDNEILTKFYPEDLAKVLLWIDSKSDEKELSMTSVFDIKDLELVSSNMKVPY